MKTPPFGGTIALLFWRRLNRLLGPIQRISHLGAHCVRFLRFALVSDHHHRPQRQKKLPFFSTPTSGHLASSRVGGGVANPDSDLAILFFADDAGGFGKLWRISKTDAEAIGNLISKELSEFGGWGPLQFYGTTLCNHAPDLVTRDFFVRLVREAFDRHPDLIHASDESYDSPEHFVEENYREW